MLSKQDCCRIRTVSDNCDACASHRRVQGTRVRVMGGWPLRQGAVGPMERFAVASGGLKVALDWLLRSGAEGADAAIKKAFDALRRRDYLRTGVELKPMPKGIPFQEFQFAYRKERHRRTVRQRNRELASVRLEDGRDGDEDFADLCPLFS